MSIQELLDKEYKLIVLNMLTELEESPDKQFTISEKEYKKLRGLAERLKIKKRTKPKYWSQRIQ